MAENLNTIDLKKVKEDINNPETVFAQDEPADEDELETMSDVEFDEYLRSIEGDELPEDGFHDEAATYR